MRAFRTVRLPATRVAVPATAAAALVLLAVGVFACSQLVAPVSSPSPSASVPVVGLASGQPSPTASDLASFGPGTSDASSSPAGSASTSPGSTPSAGPAATRTPAPAPKRAAPCTIFPSSNVWNRDISKLPVASNSARMIAAIGLGAPLHPDFDAVGGGIPYNLVTASTPRVNVSFQYADESDPNPYPIPARPRIEGGSDRHILLIDTSACRLWELYDAVKSGSSWTAGSGATWNLRSNALRPAGWTSADAAGLPIFPGLVRYEEVATGVIRHAFRFTAPSTCGYIYPARHLTAPACSNLPPMGLRVRLKASVDISGFGPNARVVLTALKKYGMILADNGSPWYVTGTPDSRWNDNEFHQFGTLTGADFEVVDTSGLR
jgi:hypothetical protein